MQVRCYEPYPELKSLQRKTEFPRADIIDFSYDDFLVCTLQVIKFVINHIPGQRGPLSEFSTYTLGHVG